LRQLRAEVGAVGRGALVQPGAECLRRLEDAGVVGEQAEQEAHQQQFQRMARVATRLEQVVEAAHLLGRLDVHRVLRLDLLRAIAGDEAEMLDPLVQVGELEFDFGIGFEVVQTETDEVGHDDIARQVALRQSFEVIRRLGEGAVEVLLGALVLDQ